MFITVILDAEYFGMGARIKWFIKNIYHAKKNDWLIVTHEYLGTNFEELLKSCDERFYEEFEMGHISKEDLQEMDICYIPDYFFDKLYKKDGARSKVLLDLSNNRQLEFEKYIKDAIDAKLKKTGEKEVEGIFNCLHCYKSIISLSEYYDCPLIPYVFSSIRKVHGYQQTLYMANMSGDLFYNDQILKMYEEYKKEGIPFEPFSRKEILLLLGKERNLPLLPLLNISGEYEMGVIREPYQILPQSYQYSGCTDDDIYYECERLFGAETIITRMHPVSYEQLGVGKKHMKNDPVSFVLSCKRAATLKSQMILKVALWNRVACVFDNVLPYSFLFSKKFDEMKPISEEDLNFILFCYLIPNKCMFDIEYWRWRKTNPKTAEICCRHLNEILNELGYSEEISSTNQSRLSLLLERRCDRYLARKIKNDEKPKQINFKCLSSRLRLLCKDGSVRDMFCLNAFRNEENVSTFEFDADGNEVKGFFYPLDDVDGFVELRAVSVNENLLKADYFRDFYCPKGKTDFQFELVNGSGKTVIEVVWTEVKKEWV